MPECVTIVDNAIEVGFLLGNGTKTIHIVQHASATQGFNPSVVIANNMLTRIGGLITSSGLNAQIPTAWALGGVQMKDLRSGGNAYIASNSAGVPGTGAGDILPYQIAAVQTLRTARAGKRYRGRSYWAPFTESANGPDNHFMPAMNTAFNAFCAGYISAFNADGLTLAVMHRPTFLRTETTCTISEPGFVTVVTQTLSRDTMWETQRRRRS